MTEETDLTFCGKKLEPKQLVELKYVGKLIGRGTTIENIEKSWSSFIETSLAELAAEETPAPADEEAPAAEEELAPAAEETPDSTAEKDEEEEAKD